MVKLWNGTNFNISSYLTKGIRERIRIQRRKRVLVCEACSCWHSMVQFCHTVSVQCHAHNLITLLNLFTEKCITSAKSIITKIAFSFRKPFKLWFIFVEQYILKKASHQTRKQAVGGVCVRFSCMIICFECMCVCMRRRVRLTLDGQTVYFIFILFEIQPLRYIASIYAFPMRECVCA